MAVGMGIHGEPGLEVRPLGTADEIARLLVEGLLADAPDDHGTRVAVIVVTVAAAAGTSALIS